MLGARTAGTAALALATPGLLGGCGGEPPEVVVTAGAALGLETFGALAVGSTGGEGGPPEPEDGAAEGLGAGGALVGFGILITGDAPGGGGGGGEPPVTISGSSASFFCGITNRTEPSGGAGGPKP